MSETGHTPGPWLFEKRLTTEIGIRGAERTLIAGVRCDSYMPNDEACANAALIAAAPELLAACKSAVAALRTTGVAAEGDGWFEAVLAAITKATGKAQ